MATDGNHSGKQGLWHRLTTPSAKWSVLALVVIGQNAKFFNRLYAVAGKAVPAFWGRQVDHAVPDMVQEAGLRVSIELGYPKNGRPGNCLPLRKGGIAEARIANRPS